MSIVQEPCAGEELISIVLATSAVELYFQDNVLQIGGHFTLSRPGHPDEHFMPERQIGAIQLLWSLIGRVVVSTHWGPNWGDTVDLVFDNAATIRIPSVSKGFRGTILGKSPPPGTSQIEDF